MTAPNNLDLTGNFQTHPFAELTAEIAEAQLDGSLRLSRENQKIVVYFNAGEIVFAVSNARSARLFEILLRENRIDENLLSEIPNYAADLEFAKFLVEKKLLGKPEADALFVHQIEEILRDALRWANGEWIFSPLVRIKQGIQFKIASTKILIEYARELPGETIFRRFRSSKEIFQAVEKPDMNISLQSHEAFVLSRFGDSQMTIDQINTDSGLPTTVVFQTLYTLWLGGFLTRHGWNSAFTAHRLEAISSARLALKKEADQTGQIAPKSEIAAPPTAPEIVEIKQELTPAEERLRLEDYLERVETARNFYESLAVETKVPAAEIKKSYFSLAKQFHPDRFHRESDTELLRRIQKAFGAIAKAYDTLRNEDSRSAYDFKIRKELSQMQKPQNAGGANDKNKQAEVAAENFEEGFKLLMDESYADATLFLARAVHLAPDVARYHAYYGKALAEDETQRYKSESELQTAVRLDPKNATFRIILAEFFIENNLLKRAEGELTRFLSIFPNNREAQTLLDSLHKKRLN